MDKPVHESGKSEADVAVDVLSFGSRMSDVTVPDPLQFETEEPPPPELELVLNLLNVKFHVPVPLYR